MARRTDKQIALDYAASKGIILEEQVGGWGDADQLEIYGGEGHMSEGGNPTCHTIFVHLEDLDTKTWAAAYRDALEWMKDMEPCPEYCHCRS